ncbi:MAG: hypothetical protein H6747_05690 [Deltaproteobacteria bacterium]|nr:hypothetical protein [Deltaproteobacteria bacterium]
MIFDEVERACRASETRLFTVDPSPSESELLALLEAFAGDHARQGHSLSDVAVIDLAKKTKARLGNNSKVIIWTWERKAGGIRSFAPDAEEYPFP